MSALSSRVSREWMQRDPLVVDRRSMTVLDGMHRLKALGSLGVTHVACYLVEYIGDEEVKLLRWSRCLVNPTERVVKRFMGALGLERETTPEEAFERLASGKTRAAMTWRERAWVHVGRRTKDRHAVVRRFDALSSELKQEVGYVGEQSLESASYDRTRAVLLTPRLTKEEVVQAAASGRLLPHKSTMHVLPLRPVGINISISRLLEGGDLERVLDRALEQSRVRVMEPPADYEGRLYPERLVVLG